MHNKTILINGHAQTGKDTVINIIKAYSAKKGIFVFACSTIDTFKHIAYDSFNWDGIKDEKGRQLLSDLKLSYTAYNKNFILTFIENAKPQVDWQVDTITIICVRDIPELEQAKNFYRDELITLLITRPNLEKFNNVADANVTNFNYDYTIHNDGSLEELKLKVEEFLNEIKDI